MRILQSLLRRVGKVSAHPAGYCGSSVQAAQTDIARILDARGLRSVANSLSVKATNGTKCIE